MIAALSLQTLRCGKPGLAAVERRRRSARPWVQAQRALERGDVAQLVRLRTGAARSRPKKPRGGCATRRVDAGRGATSAGRVCPARCGSKRMTGFSAYRLESRQEPACVLAAGASRGGAAARHFASTTQLGRSLRTGSPDLRRRCTRTK
ncbi:MAG: hypothetical protein AMXMBFR66_16290 [Pseudomonadota bacterium]|nr:hypothetical protein [Rubrivivax sp.]